MYIKATIRYGVHLFADPVFKLIHMGLRASRVVHFIAALPIDQSLEFGHNIHVDFCLIQWVAGTNIIAVVMVTVYRVPVVDKFYLFPLACVTYFARVLLKLCADSLLLARWCVVVFLRALPCVG